MTEGPSGTTRTSAIPRSYAIAAACAENVNIQPHRRPGGHRDHLRNVEDASARDAEVALNQVEPGDDFLHPLGKPLIPNLLPPLQVSSMTPLQRMP